MTFEEVHDKIFSGGKASSLSEAKESGEILTTYGGKSQQMFAVVLAESKKCLSKMRKNGRPGPSLSFT